MKRCARSTIEDAMRIISSAYKQKICHINSVCVNKQGFITLRTRKTTRGNEGREAMVPSAGSLFEAIQKTVETAYEVRVRGVDETNRLATINCLKKSTMQESILNIQLMNRPIMRKSERKDNPNSDGFDYWIERLIEINTGFLGESTENPLCLVSVKGAIGLKFVPKDPLVGNNVGIVLGTNKIPSVVR